MFVSLSKVSLRTSLKYRRGWNKNGPAVKALRRFMPSGSNGFRLYIPIGPGAADVLGGRKAKEKIKVPQSVRLALKRKGFKVSDYKAKRCVKIGDKEQRNEFNIGKVIADDRVAKAAFDNDPQLQNSENAKAGGGVYAVISCHPYDIIGMSTGRDWDKTSCMRLKDSLSPGNDAGLFNEHVYHDVAEGTMVAYAIRGDDMNIEDPMCRVLIKPFIKHNETDDEEEFDSGDSDSMERPQNDGNRPVLYRKESKVYGNNVAGFTSVIDRFLRVLNSKPTPGKYFLADRLYNDGIGGRAEAAIVSDDGVSADVRHMVDDADSLMNMYKMESRVKFIDAVVKSIFTKQYTEVPTRLVRAVAYVQEASSMKDKATIEKMVAAVLNKVPDGLDDRQWVDSFCSLMGDMISRPATAVPVRAILDTNAMRPYTTDILKAMELRADISPARRAAFLAAVDKNWLNSRKEEDWADSEDVALKSVTMIKINEYVTFNIRNLPEDLKAKMWMWATIVRGGELYDKNPKRQDYANQLLMRMKPSYPGNVEELARAVLPQASTSGEFAFAITNMLKNLNDQDFVNQNFINFGKIVEDRRMYRDVMRAGNQTYVNALDAVLHTIVERAFTKRAEMPDFRNRHLMETIRAYIKNAKYRFDWLGSVQTYQQYANMLRIDPKLIGYIEGHSGSDTQDRRVGNRQREAVSNLYQALSNMEGNLDAPIQPVTTYASVLFNIAGTIGKYVGVDMEKFIEFHRIDDADELEQLCQNWFSSSMYQIGIGGKSIEPFDVIGVTDIVSGKVPMQTLMTASSVKLCENVRPFIKSIRNASDVSVEERTEMVRTYCEYLYDNCPTLGDEDDFHSEIDDAMAGLTDDNDWEAIYDEARNIVAGNWRSAHRLGGDVAEAIEYVLDSFPQDEDDIEAFFNVSADDVDAESIADEIYNVRESIEEWHREIEEKVDTISNLL